MKKILNFFLIIIILLFTSIVYLSFVGIETNSFNNRIKSQVKTLNQDVKLELKKVKFLLRPLTLKIDIKTLGPNIIHKDKILKLESIKTKISIGALIKNQFSLDNLQISTKSIQLKEIIKFTRSIKDSPQLFILEKISKSGQITSEIDINFDQNGKIKNDYKVKGILRDANFEVLNKYNLNNLNFIFNIKNQNYNFQDIKLKLNGIQIFSKKISIDDQKNNFFIKGEFDSEKKYLDQNNSLSKLFRFNKSKLIFNNASFSSNNKFSFKMNNKFKTNDLKIKSEINLEHLILSNGYKSNYFFPKLENKIELKKNKIKINYSNRKIEIKGEGNIKLQKSDDQINYKINKNKDNLEFDCVLNINKNPFSIDFLNYKKKEDTYAKLNLNGKLDINGKVLLEQILFKEKNNEILIKKISLDKSYRIEKLDSVKINILNENQILNQLNLKMSKKNFILDGEVFDATKLINDLIHSESQFKFNKIFNNKNILLKTKIKKVYLDKNNFVNDLKSQINLKNYKIHSLKLVSFFNESQNFTMTINSTNNYNKVMTLYSSKAKPLIKNYKFIKGFEEGSLDFYSTKKNNISNSVLKIYDFKLKELPVLTKLLTLASLQGIADILSGEGIRFNEFEMNFRNEGSLMTIDEIYAIGPAISILMEGYVEKNQIISLRGTLVPATTLNKTIGSIPIFGDILVGKKTGEGVFGVSFKIKGPPKKLQTTVNPIKTLTPRFITRTLEKIKKN